MPLQDPAEDNNNGADRDDAAAASEDGGSTDDEGLDLRGAWLPGLQLPGLQAATDILVSDEQREQLRALQNQVRQLVSQSL